MRPALQAASVFALVAFLFVLAVDGLLSLVYQAPPIHENRRDFLVVHGVFHGAVLVLSNVGALIAFAINRRRLPSLRQLVIASLCYGLVTVFAGVGSFMLAGLLGAAAWMTFGSMAFAFGATALARTSLGSTKRP